MKTVSVLVLSLLGGGAAPRGEVLEFTAGWCTYCRDVAPTVKTLQREGLPIRQIDADRQPEELKKYGVTGLPTFVLVVDNREVERVSGAVSESTLRRMAGRIPAAEPAKARTPSPTPSAIRVELGEPTTVPRPAPGTGVVGHAAVEEQREQEEDQGFFGDIASKFKRKPKAAPEVRGQSGGAHALAPQSDEAAMNASVRLQVVSAGQRLQGSGTIIQSQAGRTLILTCGNLFAEKAKIEVDFPGNTGAGKFVGTLVRADRNADVGIVQINTDEPLPSSPIALLNNAPHVGEQAVSFGASEGQAIARQQTRVLAINKYEGPDNLECKGVPMQGRCGGGLFNASGELIGICIASGSDPDTGMYCGLSAIHDMLTACGLNSLIEPPPAAESAAVAMDADLEGGAVDLGAPRPMPKSTGDMLAFAAADDAAAASAATGVEPAVHRTSPGREDDLEVIVTIRSKNSPATPARTIKIHRASPKLMSILRGEVGMAPPAADGLQRSAGRPITQNVTSRHY
jgi:thiol-disulfide isomerase/thioredoxin